MDHDAATWFARRTYSAARLPGAAELVPLLRGRQVSVVVPALNEAATIGSVVGVLRRELVDAVPLVGELVVLDGGSTDGTAALAAAAGADVVALSEVPAAAGVPGGKGTALWASLQVTTGDLVVWVDADIEDLTAEFVTGLVAPLLLEPAVSFVKACYDRPLRAGSAVEATGGGRVTELVARPLLAASWPALTGMVQPLSGEYAGRRALLESLPFATGYGVELAILVHVWERVGLEGMAQVDLGRRTHRNRPDSDLGQMAAAIIATAAQLRGAEVVGADVVQFAREDGEFVPRPASIPLRMLPPVESLVRR